MAKKNTSKNTHQQKNAKKTAPKEKTTEQDITEQVAANETDVLQDDTAIESVVDNAKEPTLSELVDEQDVDVSMFDPNEPIEILFVLGEEETEEAIEQSNVDRQEPNDEITRCSSCSSCSAGSTGTANKYRSPERLHFLAAKRLFSTFRPR